MVGIKEAIKESLANFVEMFPEEKDREVRLEEAALSEDLSRWKVTVSYSNPAYQDEMEQRRGENNGLSFLRQSIPARFYKTLLLKADDGKLVGIKNDWDTSF